MSVITKDLGAATAYGYAVEKGYTGTEEEFAELMASYATVGQTAVAAKDAAVAAKTAAQTAATTATNKASEATTAAQTATTKAGEASTSASTATSAKDTAVSASQTATSKATEATTAAATATSAASTATTAKDDAVSAKTAAQTARTGAETARDAVQASAAQIATNASDITQLKEDLSESKNGKMYINGSFSYGIFNSSNFPESDPRKFNAVMMTAEAYDRDITLVAKSGYNFLAYWYDENDACVGKSANWETSRTIPENTPFRLWVRQTPLDTSVVLDLETVKKSIIFNTEIKDEIDKNSADVATSVVNTELTGYGKNLINTQFKWGTMNTTTGAVVVDTGYKYQVVMPNAVSYGRDVAISCESGYRYQVWFYDSNDTYLTRTNSFKTDADKYTVPAGSYFRLFVTLNPPTNSAVVVPEIFARKVFVSTQIDNRVTAIETSPLSSLPSYILNTLSDKKVGQLSKGYILLSCDDGTEGLATYTIPMLAQKEVPCTFGLLSTSPIITNATYLETLLGAIEDGCCVAMHGSAQWATFSESALNDYFDSTEAVFTTAGITEIHGSICPGGAGIDTNKLVQAVAGGRYGAVFSGGLQGELKYGNYNAVGARTNMYAMPRYSAIGFTQQTYQQAVDEAYDNHYILCPFWHDYTIVDNAEYKAIIEGMIDYAKTKGLTFITMKDLPNIM